MCICTHTKAGFTIKTELHHHGSSHWNCWLDTLTQWFIYIWFICGSKQVYALLMSNSQFWANQERGHWTKQCPNSDENKFKRLQFYLHISDYLWLSLSLIRLCELQILIVPWKQNAYKHSVFLFQRSKTINVLVTSPKYPKKTKVRSMSLSPWRRTFHPRDFPCWSAVSRLRRVVIPFKAAAHVMVGASMAHMFFG